MPPKRTHDGFLVPALPKRFRAGSAMPASRETSPALLRPRSSSLNRAHAVNDKRQVSNEDWKYGRNKFGIEKTHLIVFEAGNRIFARVYSLCNKVYWRCMGCRRIDNKATRAEFINGMLYAPVTSFHRCKPKPYADIRQEQEKLEKKFADACLIAEESDEADESANIQHVDHVQFNHPSSEWLRDKCDPLGIEYAIAAFQLWAKSNITTIAPTSTPSSVEGEPSSAYSCISKLLTGTKRSAAKIEKAVNKNLSSKFKILQKFKNIDFSKISRDNKILEDLIFADEITDFHLEFLARWFACRIGIFEGNRWNHFGNWSSSDNKTITILLNKEQQNLYQVVLTLN